MQKAFPCSAQAACSSLTRARLLALSITLLVLIWLFPVSACAQPPGGERPDKVIDAKMQSEVIDSVTQALNEIYVFPDVAKKMEKHLRSQYKKKAYKDITSLSEFAQKLTEDLQEISHDRHLWVRFAPDELLAQFQGDTLTARFIDDKAQVLDEFTIRRSEDAPAGLESCPAVEDAPGPEHSPNTAAVTAG